jgi:putative transposase
MSFTLKSKLPRLAREFYRGHAMVFWTHTIEKRKTGWLNDAFHNRFRELLLHACGRYAVASPCYVLMPDHWHLVWLGLRDSSDQYLATAFLRKNIRPVLGAAQLQDRAHDRVLREPEHAPEAFQSACSYVCNNPQRANLCADWREWPYLGAMILGYPDIDPRTEDFWPDFWKIHNRLVEDPCASAQGHGSPLRKQRDMPL